MGKAITSFVLTIIMGLFGIFLGAYLNLEGYLGSVFAIATMGAFIISSMEEKRSNSSND